MLEESKIWYEFLPANHTRKDNLNKLIFAHLNFNSIRNKFDFLADIIKDNIDIFMISETKVDDVFPDG